MNALCLLVHGMVLKCILAVKMSERRTDSALLSVILSPKEGKFVRFLFEEGWLLREGLIQPSSKMF